ncbi:replication restart helicase PriA [Sphingobacterium hungaricum]|uniref:Replication restart protein PriA n=1 Tax=Sphingobacterium hungaricum TaxID=2082723 RepID=A0A928UYC3_9SPHI|nr:primosomal protein N' [Sphingobacterium hungaricum]MBE8713630.1 primosomal protein N' [Sphingobacterium hungaricum]
MANEELFDDHHSTLFIEVILPLAIAKTYTYRVPQDLNSRIQVGVRVIVQFGRNKIYSAIVRSIQKEAPQKYEAKYILDVVDDQPIVLPKQLELWDWMASYYMCYLGEIMQAALPAALKMASETKIVASNNPELDRSTLSDKAFLVLDALDIAPELKVSDVMKILGQKSVFPLLKSLFDKGFILISEEIKQRYKAKTKAYLTLNPEFSDAEGFKELLDSLNKAEKQQDAVLAFFQLQKVKKDISRKEVMELAGVAAGTLKALIDKEIFVVNEKVVSRFAGYDVDIQKEYSFSPAQQTALEEVHRGFAEKDVLLLHGVTASGKTQIYIRLIEEMLASGKSALFLLPEIALTTQITERLKLYFGNKLGVYHSKFNDNERAEVWHKVMSKEFQVVVGARSSIFLPFQDLGLIIVDEEHETSYKQQDPAPRYHARDTAIYLASKFGSKILLGSATPSIESYYNAKAEKYALVELKERYGDAEVPSIQILNMTEEGRKDDMFTYFTGTLLRSMEESIAKKEQIILFQNRRGHTPFLQCKTCGWVAKCVNCDVSLTYHKATHHLHCHYCGHTEPPVSVCPACGMPHIDSKGFGTERVEEELQLLLPKARIARLDLDSTKGKYGFDKILTAFDEQEYDILIGTQMIAKGLDFGRVNLIGILNADSMINYPDFRAYERAFTLFSQVAGRAGRRQSESKVIIQTYTPNHRVLQQVVNHDYEGMFNQEIIERKNYHYPPFYKLIQISLKHSSQQTAQDAAQRLAQLLRTQLAHRVIGPEPPLISRVRNQYIQNITLKIDRVGISVSKVKEFLTKSIVLFQVDKNNNGVRVLLDVDPY